MSMAYNRRLPEDVKKLDRDMSTFTPLSTPSPNLFPTLPGYVQATPTCGYLIVAQPQTFEPIPQVVGSILYQNQAVKVRNSESQPWISGFITEVCPRVLVKTLDMQGGWNEREFLYLTRNDKFCVSAASLPKITKNSMKDVTVKQVSAQQGQTPSQTALKEILEVTDYFSRFQTGLVSPRQRAYMEELIRKLGANHNPSPVFYGQITAPRERHARGQIIGPEGTHFAELTNHYKLDFVWFNRNGGYFQVWGRDRANVLEALRQLLYHKLKTQAGDNNEKLRELIQHAETGEYRQPNCVFRFPCLKVKRDLTVFDYTPMCTDL